MKSFSVDGDRWKLLLFWTDDLCLEINSPSFVSESLPPPGLPETWTWTWSLLSSKEGEGDSRVVVSSSSSSSSSSSFRRRHDSFCRENEDTRTMKKYMKFSNKTNFFYTKTTISLLTSVFTVTGNRVSPIPNWLHVLKAMMRFKSFVRVLLEEEEEEEDLDETKRARRHLRFIFFRVRQTHTFSLFFVGSTQ